MKYITYITTCAFALSLFVSPLAYAEEDTDRGNDDAVRELEQERENARTRLIEERKANQEARAEATAELQKKREEFQKEWSSKQAEIKKEMEARKAEFAKKQAEIKAEAEKTRKELKTKREEIKNRLTDERKVKVAEQLSTIKDRMTDTAKRLTQIADRTESRITKLDSSSVDTIQGKALLAEARLKITSAETLIARIDTNAIGTSESPDEAYVTIKSVTSEARSALTEAHKALVSAISSLNASAKASEVSADDESETAASTNQ